MTVQVLRSGVALPTSLVLAFEFLARLGLATSLSFLGRAIGGLVTVLEVAVAGGIAGSPEISRELLHLRHRIDGQRHCLFFLSVRPCRVLEGFPEAAEPLSAFSTVLINGAAGMINQFPCYCYSWEFGSCVTSPSEIP